jgi:HK97 family phage major capsid protein
MIRSLAFTASAAALLASGAAFQTKEDASDPALLAKAVDAFTTKADERLGGLDTKAQEADARLTEIEQKMARRGVGGADAPQTAGSLVTAAEEFKQVGSNWRGRARIEVKATTLTTLTTDAAGSAGGAVVVDRQAGVITPARRKLRVRSLFMPGKTKGGGIEWPQVVGRTNGAATQAEGATKGQSDLQIELKTWPVRTIAHFMIASKQLLDDAPALESLIDGELRYGLADVEDHQLLTGGGTGTDLSGVYTTATAFSAPFEAQFNATMIDVLLQAIAQCDAADYETDGIVLNPLDWRVIQSLKDDEGRYLSAGPFSAEQIDRLWQMNVATTKAMAQDKFLVGAFRQGAQIFDREEATVEISTEDSDNFRRNLVTLRGEERLAFVVKHEDAFIKGDFSEALAL